MFEVHGENLKDLWELANLELWNMDPHDFIRPGVTAHSFHNQLIADTCEVPDMSLSFLGYTKTKWSMLMRLYFDAESFAMGIRRLQMYKNEPKGKKFVVDIPFRFNPRLNRTGECLMGMTMRFSQNFGWEAEIYSRASESVARWGVDLIFFNVYIREIGKHLGFEPKDVRLYWNSASMFQSCTTGPLFFALTGRERLMTMRPQTKWQSYIQKRYRETYLADVDKRKYVSFRSQQRVLRAFDAQNGNFEFKNELRPEELLLPPYDLEAIDEDFFDRKGFR